MLQSFFYSWDGVAGATLLPGGGSVQKISFIHTSYDEIGWFANGLDWVCPQAGYYDIAAKVSLESPHFSQDTYGIWFSLNTPNLSVFASGTQTGRAGPARDDFDLRAFDFFYFGDVFYIQGAQFSGGGLISPAVGPANPVASQNLLMITPIG